MYEYLIYYSPRRNKYVKLGPCFNSLIMYNDLRDFSWNYSTNSGKIGSFTNAGVYTKTVKIKWTNDFGFERYKKFMDLITADVIAGVQGYLFFPGGYYLLCNIISGSTAKYLHQDDYFEGTYKIVTDRNEFRSDWRAFHSFPSGSADWYTRNISTKEGFCGADLFINISTSSDMPASSVKGVLNVKWIHAPIGEDISRYGIAEATSLYDEIRINTYKRTLIGFHGDEKINIFNKRIKDGIGGFYEPKEPFVSVSMTPQYSGAYVEMNLSLKHISAPVGYAFAPFDMVPTIIDFETGQLVEVPEDE